MSVVVRFAPSPTGYLHIGNARAAVINWLFARKNNGKFMLRIDDTDTERSKQEYIDNLYKDLEWLHLDYDLFARQSDRIEQYRTAQQFLIDSGRLYPCYETSDELDMKRKFQLAKGKPPIYDRSALHATQKQIHQWEAEGRKPHWRFRLNDGIVSWNDMLKGKLSFNTTHSLSDPVLVKEDGSFLYTLSSIVDDLEFGITHIIRGEDHITNTAVQIQLLEALSQKPVAITFAHLSLLFDQNGQPLSKRLNSFCLKNLRETEIEPMALNCLIASLGSSTSPYLTYDLKDLAQHFELEHIKGGARVDEHALTSMSHKLLHSLPWSIARQRQAAFPFTELEWNVIREALNCFSDHALWNSILHQNIHFKDKIDPNDRDYVQKSWEYFPDHPIDETSWKSWTTALKSSTNRSGPALAHPLRLALTGFNDGPEMRKLLPLFTREMIQKRLRTAL